MPASGGGCRSVIRRKSPEVKGTVIRHDPGQRRPRPLRRLTDPIDMVADRLTGLIDFEQGD
jgi:hypothetical protein